jgi:large subunit ribosomal protein L35
LIHDAVYGAAHEERLMTMPKMKTHKSASKRFRVTGSGRLFRESANMGHLRRKKNAKRKRRLNMPVGVSATDERRIITLLPYVRK